MGGILITGGAGSLGREIVRQVQVGAPKSRIVVYSRDEGKQSAMMREFPEGGAVGVRYMLGDIRDTERLEWALRGIDTVIHAAAIKMIDWADYNVFETVSVNTNGTISVAKACIKAGVKDAVLVSTDKAADGPVGVYGQSKLLAETVFIGANNYGDCRFNVCRYGNVALAAKSCFYVWERQAVNGEPLTVTDPAMTRFYWTLKQAARFVLDRIGHDERGVIYIPKMGAWRISDLAKMYGAEIKVIGMRCPEKRHESLWSEQESYRCYDRVGFYAIYPHTHQWGDIVPRGDLIKPGFKLTSDYQLASGHEKVLEAIHAATKAQIG